MIAYIKGRVAQLTEQHAVLENQGIGYIINASPATLSRLPRRGEEATLHTYMQVKEDDMSLFGFLAEEELSLFRQLISISGIGPKVAMAILAAMTPQQVTTAIAAGDPLPFSKVPGVGKKTAQRITLELTDKIKLSASDAPTTYEAAPEKQDAIDALIALGYEKSESLRAVLEVAEIGMAAQQIIKLALKKVAR